MRLAVFDLDYTIWHPEMYQLYGRPTLVSVDSLQRGLSHSVLKETKTNKKGMLLVDNGGSPMRMFPGASLALAEINSRKATGEDIQAAISSRTDEPQWARVCLNHMVVEDGTTLADCIPEYLREISKGNKADHIRRLHDKTGVPFTDMAFFDNERGNIYDVLRALPDVKCFYTPDGMSKNAWEDAKAAFEMSDEY